MEKVADSAEWDDGPTFGAANPMVGALRGAAPRRASDSKPPELGASPPPPSFDVEDPQRRASAPERASDAEAPGLRRTSAPASTRAALSAPASTRVPEASRGDALRRDISALDREVQAVLSKRPTSRPHKRRTVMGKAWHAAVTALVEREKEEIALRAWENAIDFGSSSAGLSIYLVAAVTESRRRDMSKCIFLVVLCFTVQCILLVSITCEFIEGPATIVAPGFQPHVNDGTLRRKWARHVAADAAAAALLSLIVWIMWVKFNGLRVYRIYWEGRRVRRWVLVFAMLANRIPVSILFGSRRFVTFFFCSCAVVTFFFCSRAGAAVALVLAPLR